MGASKAVPLRLDEETRRRLEKAVKVTGIPRATLMRILVVKWLDHFDEVGTIAIADEGMKVWNSKGGRPKRSSKSKPVPLTLSNEQSLVVAEENIFEKKETSLSAEEK